MPRPKPEPIFVVDEDTGRSAADGIRAAGGQATLLVEHCPPGTLDVDWLPQVSKWGQALITRDVSMRHVAAETKALAACGVHVFVIRAGKIGFDEIRDLMITNFAAMRRHVVNVRLPFLALVTKSGLDIKESGSRRGGKKPDDK